MLFGGIKLLRLALVGCGLALLIMGEEFRQRSRFFLLLGPLCCDLGIDQAERLRQPTGAVEKTLGLFCHIALVCTENPIRVDDVTESRKLAE